MKRSSAFPSVNASLASALSPAFRRGAFGCAPLYIAANTAAPRARSPAPSGPSGSSTAQEPRVTRRVIPFLRRCWTMYALSVDTPEP